jgi:hypothetical protein
MFLKTTLDFHHPIHAAYKYSKSYSGKHASSNSNSRLREGGDMASCCRTFINAHNSAAVTVLYEKWIQQLLIQHPQTGSREMW